MNLKSILILGVLLMMMSCGTSVQMLSQDDFEVTYTSDLPDELVEISSLQYHDGLFYGINDSGGKPIIYYFNQENPARITRQIELSVSNNDWETTAESDSLLFVGDTGNNRGERDDLKVYYVPKKKLNPSKSFEKVQADTIGFLYPEQEIFENHAYNHDFDLEAMLWHNRKLHLFTKAWKSNNTTHYTLDIVKGKQPAWLVESYDTGFMVTAADLFKINQNSARLALIGYTRDGDVYLLISDINPNKDLWFNNSKKQYHLGFSGNVGQVEGVAFKSKDEICYSAEAIKFDGAERTQNITCIRLK